MHEIQRKIEEIQLWISITLRDTEDWDLKSALKSLDYECDEVFDAVSELEKRENDYA